MDLISRHAEDVRRRTETMRAARESELQGLEAMLRSEFGTKLQARENELRAQTRETERQVETLKGRMAEMQVGLPACLVWPTLPGLLACSMPAPALRPIPTI